MVLSDYPGATLDQVIANPVVSDRTIQ